MTIRLLIVILLHPVLYIFKHYLPFKIKLLKEKIIKKYEKKIKVKKKYIPINIFYLTCTSSTKQHP